jgi:isopenicillin N synthase-like dioxygenase
MYHDIRLRHGFGVSSLNKRNTNSGKMPVIDISALSRSASARAAVVTEVGEACRDVGFLTITGARVDARLVENMRRVVEDVFAVDEQIKRSQAITRDNYRGYIPMGLFRANGTDALPDQYEGYKLHQETAFDDPIRRDCQLYGPNRWPAQVPDGRDVILAYWSEMDRIAFELLGALEQYLALAPGVISGCFDKPLTNMTLLHYPPQEPTTVSCGVHPHKDTDALTIIARDPIGGLEVKCRNGGWVTPNCPENGFVVNIGDMLELWSGGRLVSTPHRVVNICGKHRYSFPYFAVPRHDVMVEPLLPALPGFSRPAVDCGYWSKEIWRTNWPDEAATASTPALGTLPN